MRECARLTCFRLSGLPGSSAGSALLSGAVVVIVVVLFEAPAMSAPDCVTVAVRCRPMSAREQNQHEAPIISITKGGGAESQAVCSLTAPESGAPPREFSFDFAYDDTSDQVTLYDDLGAPLLEKAFCGWNGTIFAYGQTGSGKSFSMTGSAEDPGIIPRMNTALFDRVAAIAADDPNISVLVTCSFMEIHNEVLRDLLDPAGTRGAAAPKSRLGAEGKIEIKEHPTLGVYAQGLREIGVSSHAEIHALMLRGNEMRATAATLMNASSSRSHSIFTIKVRVRGWGRVRGRGRVQLRVRVRVRVRVSSNPNPHPNPNPNQVVQKQVLGGQQKETRATINLVDLAGSERASKSGATGPLLQPLKTTLQP